MSLNKYLDDLHNMVCIMKLQIQVIGICEHKIKKGPCLNNLPPGHTFEFEPLLIEVLYFSLMTIYATK